MGHALLAADGCSNQFEIPRITERLLNIRRASAAQDLVIAAGTKIFMTN